ncbi:MAG: 23S rRNA (pseudouridine(1915)-N(3))-methyltransferase RlmH [Gemmatimonadaceae bacterium]|nr:23S rRNA (pseudouridine(1915)-N(3))-methyltransferase RlmH [Gemmatimonadaceae bacterium]
MRLLLCVVGTARPPLAAAIAEYETRAVRYWPLVVREVKEGKGDAVAGRRIEGERLREAAGSAVLVACTEGGATYDSRAFASLVTGWQEAARDVALLIGGAHGLDPTVLSAAAQRLSLAPFTMPHEMARLVLTEQLYRAGTLRRGEPYHK